MGTATVSVLQDIDVDVRQIPDVTVGTNPSTGTVGSVGDVADVALASLWESLLVQVGMENFRSEAASDEGDDSTAVVQLSDFPLQADQVTPMDTCDYRINVVGSTVAYQVSTQ